MRVWYTEPGATTTITSVTSHHTVSKGRGPEVVIKQHGNNSQHTKCHLRAMGPHARLFLWRVGRRAAGRCHLNGIKNPCSGRRLCRRRSGTIVDCKQKTKRDAFRITIRPKTHEDVTRSGFPTTHDSFHTAQSSRQTAFSQRTKISTFDTHSGHTWHKRFTTQSSRFRNRILRLRNYKRAQDCRVRVEPSMT